MSKIYEALQRAQVQEAIELNVPSRPAPTESADEVRRLEPELVAEIAVPANGNQNGNGKGGMRHLPLQLSRESVVIPWSQGDAPGGEHYRIIRTRIVQHPQRPSLLAISSAGSGDGKTISSINIAGVLSLRDNATVLLIDADFRRSAVSSLIGIPRTPGLAEVLSGKCGLQDAIVQAEQFPNLYILPAGDTHANPAELLDTDQWRMLCATVRERFNFVLVDGPPIAAVADYELIQECCDGVIMVVRPDHTDRTLFNRAFEIIPEDKRLGVVLNCASQWFLWKTQEAYYYSREKS